MGLPLSPSILIIGAGGQVGSVATSHFQGLGWQVTALGKEDLDITNPSEVLSTISTIAPHYLFNAAAYTFVDAAEENQQKAFDINLLGVKNIVAACNTLATVFIHISTDYVFDGSKQVAYTETDTPHPLNIYGASKAEADAYIQENSARYLILRTSWVYSAHAPCFLNTMVQLSQSRDSLSIVDDQRGTPTSAQQIVAIAHQLILGEQRGLFNAVAQGSASWYEFATEIFDQMSIPMHLSPCSSSHYPQIATRPLNSVLSIQKLMSKGILPLSWQQALAVEVALLKEAL